MSAWGEYKKKVGAARPWHALNKSNYVSEEEARKRFDTCLQCPELLQTTKQCKQCGCFMNVKVRIRQAVCPLNKW